MKLCELQPDNRRSIDATVVIPKQAFEVGSKVEFGDPKEYGEVTWIGCPPESDEECARVLAVRHVNGYHNYT